MKKLIKRLLPIIDVLIVLIVFPAALLLKMIRKAGVSNMPLCKSAFMHVGVFPILNHYYEPLFDSSNLYRPLNVPRGLPSVNWNETEQLNLLEKFNFNDELKKIPMFKDNDLTFYMDNPAFTSGDAEYFYNLIRLKKPLKIFEIGSKSIQHHHL